VATVPRRFTPRKFSLVFHSGTSKERTLAGEVVASDPEQDLAVLQVKGKDLPAPLDLTQVVEPRETMTVFTFGFPLGEDLAPERANPGVTIGRAAISSLRQDERGRLRRVQLDGEVNPGNSGGPVVDAEGRLFGVVVSKVVGTRISFAIPPAELTAMLKGRAAGVVLRSVRADSGSAELEVEVPVIDPLHRLKAVELRHVRKDALKEPLRAAPDGTWPDLPGAEKVALKVEGGKAVANVTLKGAPKKALSWVFQTAYTNGEGKSVATEPVAREINFAAAGLVRLDSPGARPWETITSKEGGLTVDMPTKPQITRSSSRSIGGRTVRVFLLGCDTDDGVYLAFRIDMPVAVPRGSEGRVMDAQRDFFAREWNGKVIREKKVLAQHHTGRDFTIQGRPDGGGVSTIRVRQYLVGRSIFAVAVLSPANWDLPEDAGRFLGSLALGEAKARATGTPAPEPTGTELPGWGLAIDPDKDCKFTPKAGSIAIDVPAAMHDSGGPDRKFNAPRVLREVDGDFVLTVKVGGDFKPGPRSTNPRSVPYLAGGILVWSDSDNFIRLERAAMRRAGRVIPHVAFLELEGGYGGAVHNELFKEGECYLRMERQGSRVLGAISGDGKTWKQLKPIDTVWPSKLKVGLIAISTSSEPFAVKFEQFDLKAKGPPRE
jgi:regulation of enolase protein 1 (concanavalin A-like superfamily)